MRRGRPAPGVEFSHSLCPRRRLNKRQDNTWGPISSTKFKTVFLSNFQALESRELEHNSPAAFLEEMLWSLHVREAWIFIVGHVDRSVPNRPRLPELAPYAFGALEQPAKCATRCLRLHESVAVAHEVEDGEQEVLREALDRGAASGSDGQAPRRGRLVDDAPVCTVGIWITECIHFVDRARGGREPITIRHDERSCEITAGQ